MSASRVRRDACSSFNGNIMSKQPSGYFAAMASRDFEVVALVEEDAVRVVAVDAV